MPNPLCVELLISDSVAQPRASSVRSLAAEQPGVEWGGALAQVTVLYAGCLDQSVLAQAAALVARATQPILIAASVTGTAEVIDALLRLGVWNVLIDADDKALFAAVVASVTRLCEVERAATSNLVRKHLLGQSAKWFALLREVIWVAKFSNASVLLSGETGTGKELIARLVHTLDSRSTKGELVVVDCTTLGSELAGSELFGHERGAFTGAHVKREGAATLANGGTLFLDEVGELHLSVQAQLLRLLQEGSYKSVGGGIWQHSSFRLVCATHRDLREAVNEGRFRQDLFFRINGWNVSVPPLRERRADIALLANRFLREFGCGQDIDQHVACALAAHPFPGNVRELRQLMMQTAIKHCGEVRVSLGDLPLTWHSAGHVSAPPSQTASAPVAMPVNPAVATESSIRQWVAQGLGLREIAQRAGDIAIHEALAAENNHLGRSARRLGVTERAIQLRKAQRSTQHDVRAAAAPRDTSADASRAD